MEINTPGFTAESSLYKSRNRYNGRGTYSHSEVNTVVPTMLLRQPAVKLSRYGGRGGGGGGGYGGGGDGGGDGGGCWEMSEGGAYCFGCCTPVEGGYHCWEYCYDVSEAGGGRPAT